MLITAWLAAQELQELLNFHQRVQVGLAQNKKKSGRPRISLENPESNTLEPSQQRRVRMKSMPKRASDEKLQRFMHHLTPEANRLADMRMEKAP